MQVLFKTGDIIREQTEGLVCSGNVYLNMSGGVNGALLQAGGETMQVMLHEYLEKSGRKFVEPGFTMRIGPEPFHFKSIVYTVAIDAFYETSIELVEKSLTSALKLLQQDGCKTVAIPALATGYGRLSKSDFGKAMRQCHENTNWPFEEIRVVLCCDSDRHEVEESFRS